MQSENDFRDAPPEDSTPKRVQVSAGEYAGEEPFVIGVYEAVAESLGLDPYTDDISIREQINPDALDAVFNDTSGAAHVGFSVEDAQVTVRSDGEIVVRPIDEA